jgi:hypothetical protein
MPEELSRLTRFRVVYGKFSFWVRSGVFRCLFV